MPKGEQEKEAPGLSAHQGGFAHSFSRHLLCTYSATGTAPLQTAPTQKDEDRGGCGFRSSVLPGQDSRLRPLPALAGKPLPLTMCTDGGGREYAPDRMPATSHPFRKMPDGWRSPCSIAAHQQPGPGTRDIHHPPGEGGSKRCAPIAFWVANGQTTGAHRGGSALEVRGPAGRQGEKVSAMGGRADTPSTRTSPQLGALSPGAASGQEALEREMTESAQDGR